MTPRQARAMLALIADLYLLCQEPETIPDPAPEPSSNGRAAVPVDVP